MPKLKKDNDNKHRIKNIRQAKLPVGKKLITTQAVKVVSLNDEERLNAGDMVVFVIEEDENGSPFRTVTRPLGIDDFEDA